MKKDIERLLAGACEDQRADLKTFAETGDQDALARVHFDACLKCDGIVDKMIELRDGLPPAPAIIHAKPSFDRPHVALAIFTACLVLLTMGLGGYLVYAIFFDGRNGAAAIENRVRFVRMPGAPETCIAELPGAGGYGPTMLGTAPCAEVSERTVFDEGIGADLRAYSVSRIRGTKSCLALDEDSGNGFIFPCADDD